MTSDRRYVIQYWVVLSYWTDVYTDYLYSNGSDLSIVTIILQYSVFATQVDTM